MAENEENTKYSRCPNFVILEWGDKGGGGARKGGCGHYVVDPSFFVAIV